RYLEGWFGRGSPDPPVLCDRRSPSPRPAARHLETHGRPNGGVRRPSPNETAERRGRETLAERNAEWRGLKSLAERNKFATTAVGIKGRSRPTLQHASLALGGFQVALDMAFGALAEYDFCFVGMTFPEVRSSGMEANAVGSKRILESPEEAKSPRRILVRSLLKSRNKLRAKYRELRVQCKRWRNQAAAVERSRGTWRQRAMAQEARAREDQAARAVVESQLQQLREQSERREAESAELRARLTALEGSEKKGR